MRRKRSNALNETVELNITAFLNLMVILVPFLLITAVFSRMTVLELNLPALDALASSEESERLELQMLVLPKTLELRDAKYGRIKEFLIDQDGVNVWRDVREVLLAVKNRFPEHTEIALLLDPDVTYQQMIQVMDEVRSTQIVNAATLDEMELFPAISIGEMPAELDRIDTDLDLDALRDLLQGEQGL